MITSSSPAAESPQAAGVSLRLPGAPPPEGARETPAPAVIRLEPPTKPRIDFDPDRLMKNVREAVEHLNKQMANTGRNLGFSMDDVLNYPVVTVRNTNTGEVVRQIPSEAVIRVAHTLEDLKGLLYDATS
jgi:flagellar protein FlaG